MGHNGPPHGACKGLPTAVSKLAGVALSGPLASFAVSFNIFPGPANGFTRAGQKKFTRQAKSYSSEALTGGLVGFSKSGAFLGQPVRWQ